MRNRHFDPCRGHCAGMFEKVRRGRLESTTKHLDDLVFPAAPAPTPDPGHNASNGLVDVHAHVKRLVQASLWAKPPRERPTPFQVTSASLASGDGTKVGFQTLGTCLQEFCGLAAGRVTNLLDHFQNVALVRKAGDTGLFPGLSRLPVEPFHFSRVLEIEHQRLAERTHGRSRYAFPAFK